MSKKEEPGAFENVPKQQEIAKQECNGLTNLNSLPIPDDKSKRFAYFLNKTIDGGMDAAKAKMRGYEPVGEFPVNYPDLVLYSIPKSDYESMKAKEEGRQNELDRMILTGQKHISDCGCDNKGANIGVVKSASYRQEYEGDNPLNLRPQKYFSGCDFKK